MWFGEVVRRGNFSTAWLARSLNVSRSTIKSWCRGGPIPQRRRASIAAVFGSEVAQAILERQGSRAIPGRPPGGQRQRDRVRLVADIARRRGREELARDIEEL